MVLAVPDGSVIDWDISAGLISRLECAHKGFTAVARVAQRLAWVAFRQREAEALVPVAAGTIVEEVDHVTHEDLRWNVWAPVDDERRMELWLVTYDE